MKYTGLQSQITSNNRKSILLLMAFPILVLVMVFAFVYFMNIQEEGPAPISVVGILLLNIFPGH